MMSSARNTRHALLLFAALPLAACAPPLALPTVQAVSEQHDRSLDPPLYRALYDYAFLPQTQEKEQRVRLLIWLHYMKFNRLQLGLLGELADKVSRERDAVVERQDAIIKKYEPQLDSTYDAIWDGLNSDAPAADLDALAPKLAEVHAREQELLVLRAQSVRTLFEAQAPFLQTLTPAQEIQFTDATFLLRHRLDPYAHPGDFSALVGDIYGKGQFGAVSQATFDPNEDYLNIGGLWSEHPDQLTGPQYPDARREVLLYMVLLEPALPEALAAETGRRPQSEPTAVSGPAPGGAIPGSPAPGTPGPAGAVPAGAVPAPAGASGGSPPVPGIPTPPPPAPPGK